MLMAAGWLVETALASERPVEEAGRWATVSMEICKQR